MNVEQVKKDPKVWIHWILECDCEPMVEHCNQCDCRRKIVQQWREERDLEKQIAALKARGYCVHAKDS